MSTNPEGITNPPIDDLLEKVDSKYRLVIFAAKRARQINAYYSQLGEGLLGECGSARRSPPGRNQLSVALRELQDDMLQYTQIDPEAEAAERAAAEADPAFTFVDPFAELDANNSQS